MNKQIAGLILAWHGVYVAVTESIEHARIVLDQSDRGTLLPDRVREMRGHLISVQEKIPALADLLEELTGEVTWPMKAEAESAGDAEENAEPVTPDGADGIARPASDPEVPAKGDYDASGATPGEEAAVDEEAAAEEVSEIDDALGDPDDTVTP